MGRNISFQQLMFLQQVVDWGQIFAIILRGKKSFHLWHNKQASDLAITFCTVFTHVFGMQILTSESQKSKSLMPVLKFCCLLASLSFWLFSADLLTRNCHCSSRALRRAWGTELFCYFHFFNTLLYLKWCSLPQLVENYKASVYFHKHLLMLTLASQTDRTDCFTALNTGGLN